MDSQTKVFRAHRALALFYAAVGITVGIVLGTTEKNGFDAGVAVLVAFSGAFVAIHYFTAQACKAGKPWGRRVSQVLGVLFLGGFPIGTLIGLYLLSNTRKPWSA